MQKRNLVGNRKPKPGPSYPSPRSPEPWKYKEVRVNKRQEDLETIGEIIKIVKPDFFIELGTDAGGSAYYFADLLNEISKETGKDGKVITVESFPNRVNPRVANHPRIISINGNSVNETTVNGIIKLVSGIVILNLDSEHSKDHVLKELRSYCSLIPIGSYIIVEDTWIDLEQAGRSKYPQGGPLKAIEIFLKEHPEFEIDHSWEIEGTNNPSGYLKRVR